MMIEKITSGGQTGASRAAPDAAIQWKIQHGGWIPKERPESGRLPDRYQLQEMETNS
jgi:Circularly permutated YpsA SLOG family